MKDELRYLYLLSLRNKLQLEVKGLKFKGPHTTYALVKKELGLKGNKKRVLAQLTRMIEELKNS